MTAETKAPTASSAPGTMQHVAFMNGGQGGEQVVVEERAGQRAAGGDAGQPGRGRQRPPPGQPAAFSVTGNFTSNLESADPEKKKAFIESITNGTFHNQADKGAESALSCMMARSAAYTGREVTWDELMTSQEVWESRLDLDRLR